MQMTQTPLGKKTTMIKKVPKGGTSSRSRWWPDPQTGRLQAYRTFAAMHRYVHERCRHFRRG